MYKKPRWLPLASARRGSPKFVALKSAFGSGGKNSIVLTSLSSTLAVTSLLFPWLVVGSGTGATSLALWDGASNLWNLPLSTIFTDGLPALLVVAGMLLLLVGLKGNAWAVRLGGALFVGTAFTFYVMRFVRARESYADHAQLGPGFFLVLIAALVGFAGTTKALSKA
ncbi:MAG: hypothetical protein ACYDCK_08325 [Thermoplasmatota archaeon]